MEQEDNLVWFNMEQYISDGGLYNAVHQFRDVGSTSHHRGLQISEAVNNNADQQTQLKVHSQLFYLILLHASPYNFFAFNF